MNTSTLLAQATATSSVSVESSPAATVDRIIQVGVAT
jgi:hypothetical protein